ncbi:uncharacterized protein N0V89_010122 [Didymosphaeria variabile]|uniref:Heterokaryon incompatibility domain-containing protein n=1 Tax=Didymosphaeria variabile TaxID=1932322 RepID=A0A9W8XGF8_9PLEO|nr:uncharacterized protein N0V89_010122 [Didymosphaeria variabile]KAJ4348744.1 hypothetical protein N0V89_010122 [Didymosphaeria variabile]
MDRNLKRPASQPGTQSTKSEVQYADPADEAAVLEPYEYRTLETPNTIRIFCLEPAEAETDSLKGHIIQFDRYDEVAKLDHHQEYIAVSYAWGQADFSELLMLNGTGDGYCRYLRITSNVKVMLEHFRKRHKKLFLWIDAICLNQNDEAEKVQQIPLMREIYQQAHKSYFWLGLEDGFDTAKVFAYFRLLAVTDSIQSATNKLKDDHPGLDYVKQIRQFSNRSWFFRRWILQEAGLSRHGLMWCGYHKIQYTLFVMACRKLKSTDEAEHFPETSAIETTIAIQNLVHSSTASRSITDLLWKVHRSHCSEEKDRIGALYGLFPSSMRPKLDLAASYQQIYERVAVELVRSSPVELFLHLAHFRPLCVTKGTRVPSWIPDWSQERLRLTLPFYNGLRGALDNTIRDYFKERVKTETTADYRDDQAIWVKFLESKNDVNHQCARFTAYYSNSGSDTDIDHTESPSYNRSAVLRIQWFHPFTEGYGIPIRSVIAVPTAPQGTRISLAFVQELKLAVNNLEGSIYLHRFSALIAGTMFRDSYQKDLLECFNNLIGKELAPVEQSPGQVYTQYLSEDKILHSLAIVMFRRQLAILGCHSESHGPYYVVGPSTLQKNDRLIPLARIPQYVTQEAKTAFLDVRGLLVLENLVAVRLLHGSESQDPETHQINIQKNDDMPLDDTSRISMMAPLKATYVGLCVCFHPGITSWLWRDDNMAKRRDAFRRERQRVHALRKAPHPTS